MSNSAKIAANAICQFRIWSKTLIEHMAVSPIAKGHPISWWIIGVASISGIPNTATMTITPKRNGMYARKFMRPLYTSHILTQVLHGILAGGRYQ